MKPTPPPALPALAGPGTILRLPAEGGAAVAYRTDSLLADGWRSASRLPATEYVVGYDLQQRIAYLVDGRRRLTSLDLESGASRAVLAGVSTATVGADGSAFVIDSSGRLIRFGPRSRTTFPARAAPGRTQLHGALGGQVISLSAGETLRAQSLSLERAGPAMELAPGPVAFTWWGETLASTRGDNVELHRVADGTRILTIDLPGAPEALLFSPSGHRLLALVRGSVVVADRFTGERLGSIRLPAEGTALRGDASGRWLLVRPEAGDSIFVLDMVTLGYVATVAGRWREDLPLVAGAALLLTAEGEDVLGWDLATFPPGPLGRVRGGAVDRWMVVPWVSPRRAQEALAAAAMARATQDEALLAPADSTAGPSLWLQVSSSQNPEWAQDLVQELRGAGFSATVWPATSTEDSYRVVVGPYRTREEAEEAGRRLGRPNFVVSQPPEPAP